MHKIFCAFRRSGSLLFAILFPLSISAATNLVQMGEAGTYYFFNPTNITVNAGGTIRWTNVGAQPHDSKSRSTIGSSPTLNGGETYAFTFTNTGNYPYFCFFHRVAHPE